MTGLLLSTPGYPPAKGVWPEITLDRQSITLSAKERQGRTELEMRGYQASGLAEQTRRFMQTLDGEVYGYLRNEAKTRGVTVQGLIRAVIIPGYIGEQRPKPLLAEERNRSPHGGLSPLLSSEQVSGEISSFSKLSPTRSPSSPSSI